MKLLGFNKVLNTHQESVSSTNAQSFKVPSSDTSRLKKPMFSGVEFFKVENTNFERPHYQINITNHGSRALDDVFIQTNIDASQKQWETKSETLKAFFIKHDKLGKNPTASDLRKTLKTVLNELTITLPDTLKKELLKATKRGMFTLYLPQNKSHLKISEELTGKAPFEIRLHAREKKLGTIGSSSPKQI